MNVFISWSGERSKLVAIFLREWLSCVLQNVSPWVSSKDIDRGSLWFSEISAKLGETAVGIICLTQENKEKPWILFEAGALAKGLNSSRVCTLLVDLEPKDIGDPLAQFNHTAPDRNGIFDLVSTMNVASGAKLLDEQVLRRVFDTYWPQFESEFAEILKNTPNTQLKPRAKDDVLSEILENTRTLSNRIRKIEEQSIRIGNARPHQLNDQSIQSLLAGQLAAEDRIKDSLGIMANDELIKRYYMPRAKIKKNDP